MTTAKGNGKRSSLIFSENIFTAANDRRPLSLCSKCLQSNIMERSLHKGWLVVFVLHLCQAQDDILPSPNPEPAPPSLVDVIDAVKEAFKQVVKISKDDAVRESFEQVVEGLVPQHSIAEQPPATAEGIEDATEDASDVDEHPEEGAEDLTALQEQNEATLVSPEQMSKKANEEAVEDEVLLVQEPAGNPVESDDQPNKVIEELVQKQEEPVSESSQKAEELVKKAKTEPVESNQDPSKIAEESVQEPEELDVETSQQVSKTVREKSEDKSLVDQLDIEADESPNTESDKSPIQVELPTDPVRERTGKVVEEQAGDGWNLEQKIEFLQEQDTLESGGAEETDIRDGKKVKEIVGRADEEAEVHKSNLPKLTEQIAESQPGQHQEQVTTEGATSLQDDQEKDKEWGAVRDLVEAGAEKENVDGEAEEAEGEAVVEDPMEKTEVLATKATMVQNASHKPAEVVVDTGRAGAVKDVKERKELQESVITESNNMDDVTQETNDMNGIVTSRDPLLGPVEANQAAPASGNQALPPFPSEGAMLGDTDVLVEEPADSTQSTSPRQEVWKIGAIAAALLLILQTVVTVVYIQKCKRKPNSRAGTVKACEEGNGGVENNTANTETPTIPAEEHTALDDLPECSEVQHEAIAMTTITTDSVANSSKGL